MKKIEAVLPAIDELYKDYAEKNHFPGFTYGLVVDGKLVHTGSMGYTDVDKKTPATTQSLFRVASMSKSFTAMLISSIDDYAKYVALHLAAWPPRDEADNGPLKRSSLREMHHPWNFSGMNPKFTYPGGRGCGIVSAYAYGLGWMRDCEGREYVSHSGGLPGFGSNWRILPDYGIGIIALANLTYASTSTINLQVLDTLIVQAGLKPRQLPASAILEQRQKELTQLLPGWKNAEASGLFAVNFFADYSLETLKKETQTLFQKVGRIKTVREIVPENQLRGSYLLEGVQGNLKISFTLSPENEPLIQEFQIKEEPN